MNIPNKLQQYIENKSYICDHIGMSGAGVYIFEDMVLKVQKIDTESETEFKMLMWLNGKIPVPNVIEHICENGYSYLLTNKCTGRMACDPVYMMQPKRQVEFLAEAMHDLWSIPINDCPCDFSLDKRLEMAKDILSEDKLTGVIDLGRAGVADPWIDIALCSRSLEHNYNGFYGGKHYEGYKNTMLFEALGIRPDWERIRYYILLDELF